MSIQKLVTDDYPCTRSMGFWRHQFRGKGKQHIDDQTLEGYLEVANFSSGYNSEIRSVTTLDEAMDILDPSGPGMLHKADAQLFSAWLNFASGSVNWDQLIPIEDEDGSIIELPFHDLIARAEALLLDPESTDPEYELAKDYAEAINLLDENSVQCDIEDNGVDGENSDHDTEDNHGGEKSKKN